MDRKEKKGGGQGRTKGGQREENKGKEREAGEGREAEEGSLGIDQTGDARAVRLRRRRRCSLRNRKTWTKGEE